MNTNQNKTVETLKGQAMAEVMGGKRERVIYNGKKPHFRHPMNMPPFSGHENAVNVANYKSN